MQEEKKLTLNQLELQKQFVETYGLSPEQISFEGEKPEPIFDFEALSLLREKLTNFETVDVSQVTFKSDDNSAEAVCDIITDQQRRIVVSDFAQIGELMPDGSRIETAMQAKRVARARAMRSGIRAAGVNLLRAHQLYLEGKPLNTEPVDPRINRIKEIHVIAGEIGFIVGSDKTDYQNHIAEMFDGRTSAADLDDIELQKLVVSLRAIRRVQQVALAASQPKAAA
jgi:hypothetical protein